jgi:hypothetical protein
MAVVQRSWETLHRGLGEDELQSFTVPSQDPEPVAGPPLIKCQTGDRLLMSCQSAVELIPMPGIQRNVVIPIAAATRTRAVPCFRRRPRRARGRLQCARASGPASGTPQVSYLQRDPRSHHTADERSCRQVPSTAEPGRRFQRRNRCIPRLPDQSGLRRRRCDYRNPPSHV